MITRKDRRQEPNDPHPRAAGLSRRRVLRAGAFGAAALATGGRVGAGEAQETVPGSNLTPSDRRAKLYRFRLAEAEVDLTGTPARAQLVNGQTPGPEIRVTEGDLLRVVVENLLPIPATTHWHGLLLPNPMDGVPGVTQEAIPPNGVFVYEYPILQSGTYWYHSHFEAQEQAGLHGPFIIEAKEEPHHYDHDVVLFLADWIDYSPWDVVPRIRERMRTGAKLDLGDDVHRLPDGSTLDVDLVYAAFPLNGRTAKDPWTVRVKRGDRVRFRVINGSSQSFFRFMIDGHDLEVIAADGQPVSPVTVDSFVIATAERYDVITEVRDSGSFTIRAAAIGQSGGAVGVMHTADAEAVASDSPPRWRPRTLAYEQLRAPVATTLPDGPIRSFRLELGGNMKKYLWSINGQYFPDLYVEDGKADPLLIREGDRVEVEVVNPTPMFHPFHLHGHFFRLLARPGADPRAPLKDTAMVPPKGTLRFEFLADNPGRWIFRCHYLYHLLTGMARVWHYTA